MSTRRPSYQQQRRRRSRQTAQNPGSDIPGSDLESAQPHDMGYTDNESLVSSIPSNLSNRARRQRRRQAHPHHRTTQMAQPQQQQQPVVPPSPVDNLNQVSENALGTVGDTAGQLANAATDVAKPPTDYDDALKLRLDLNLDAELTLKARLHGDVTLSLL